MRSLPVPFASENQFHLKCSGSLFQIRLKINAAKIKLIPEVKTASQSPWRGSLRPKKNSIRNEPKGKSSSQSASCPDRLSEKVDMVIDSASVLSFQIIKFIYKAGAEKLVHAEHDRQRHSSFGSRYYHYKKCKELPLHKFRIEAAESNEFQVRRIKDLFYSHKHHHSMTFGKNRQQAEAK
jgi:hypothetical protein